MKNDGKLMHVHSWCSTIEVFENKDSKLFADILTKNLQMTIGKKIYRKMYNNKKEIALQIIASEPQQPTSSPAPQPVIADVNAGMQSKVISKDSPGADSSGTVRHQSSRSAQQSTSQSATRPTVPPQHSMASPELMHNLIHGIGEDAAVPPVPTVPTVPTAPQTHIPDKVSPSEFSDYETFLNLLKCKGSERFNSVMEFAERCSTEKMKTGFIKLCLYQEESEEYHSKMLKYNEICRSHREVGEMYNVITHWPTTSSKTVPQQQPLSVTSNDVTMTFADHDMDSEYADLMTKIKNLGKNTC